jgi:plasmid stabilization system protein ParE
MDYQLLFTERASSDLSGILGQIAEHDPEASSRFGSSLLDHIELSIRFPRMGLAVGNGFVYADGS